MEPVFDGHNDVLLRLWGTERSGGDPVAEFINGTRNVHIDGPRAKAGGLAGGLCAIYIPSGDLVIDLPDANGHYRTPLAAPLPRQSSLDTALEIARIALRLDRQGPGGFAARRPKSAAMADGVFAAVMHMEGCEAIGEDLPR